MSNGFSSGSSLASCSVALFVPRSMGLKLTTTWWVSPGARLNVPPPLSILNAAASAPIKLVPVTDKTALPALLMTNVCEALVFTTTAP